MCKIHTNRTNMDVQFHVLILFFPVLSNVDHDHLSRISTIFKTADVYIHLLKALNSIIVV